MDDRKGFHPLGGRVSKHFHDRHLSVSPGPSRPSSAQSDAYLSYHDTRLTREDVACLEEGWLNDNCISFWEEYLEREIISQHRRCNVVLLRPSMVFMLMQTQDAASLKPALPDFTKATHIFMPVNDNRDVEQAEGGTHWSLVLVSIVDGLAFHYDSINSANQPDGELAAKKMGELLGRNLRYVEIDSAPQQSNGSDCGIFVCALMEHLLTDKLLKAHTGMQVSMSVSDKDIDPWHARKAILRKIDSLREEGIRRLS